MIHIYEMQDHEHYWEVYGQALESDPSSLNYSRTLVNQKEYDLYLDILRASTVDFVIHTLAEYDEYHLALEDA